jgi:two-component sensor histidine kinase
MTAEPLRDREGEIVGLTVAAFDITELKQYEIDLARMNAQLQRAMTETHHRVKNNLQLISALIDMQQASSTESMIPASEFARLSANVRALSVIHDILTSEAKAGNDQETLPVKTVLEKLVDVLKQTMGSRPLSFAMDEARLAGRQATSLALVTNELVSNALKHGSGEVTILFRATGEKAILEIGDDGPGFPADFNPLTAANTGLELVENVVAWDLRGTTLYETRPEGGARIVVTFPLADSK